MQSGAFQSTRVHGALVVNGGSKLAELHVTTLRSVYCSAEQRSNKGEPIVFRPASQTAPPERFLRRDEYENPYKKELPVSHWNSQYLDDPDDWWGDAEVSNAGGGSSGGSGGSGDDRWNDFFDDDDDYDLAAFPLSLLVLCMGAVSSGLASGCILCEASFLAADALGGVRELPGTRTLPISKRMRWFRKHGNARMVLGFPISAWVRQQTRYPHFLRTSVPFTK
jgi:hypothetical protein